eukprot:664155-Amphidinium_carterae.1
MASPPRASSSQMAAPLIPQKRNSVQPAGQWSRSLLTGCSPMYSLGLYLRTGVLMAPPTKASSSRSSRLLKPPRGSSASTQTTGSVLGLPTRDRAHGLRHQHTPAPVALSRCCLARQAVADPQDQGTQS